MDPARTLTDLLFSYLLSLPSCTDSNFYNPKLSTPTVAMTSNSILFPLLALSARQDGSLTFS